MSWICDGTPKNGQSYPEAKGKHQPVDNNDLNCIECGLPKESMDPPPIPSLPWRLSVLVAFAIALMGTGSFLLVTERLRCDPGFERMAGQCVDPYRDDYLEAVEKANLALDNALNAQNLEELRAAIVSLQDAIGQLTSIPESAPVFPEAVDQVGRLRNELQYIEVLVEEEQSTPGIFKSVDEAQSLPELQDTVNRLKAIVQGLESIPDTAKIFPKAEERLTALAPKVKAVEDQFNQAQIAQDQLEAIESQATIAKEKTEKATSIATLETVETEWKEILEQLDQVTDSRFVTDRVKAQREEYNQELSKVQGQIADLVAASRPVASETTITQPPNNSETLPIYNDRPIDNNQPVDEDPLPPNPTPGYECPGDPRCLF